MKPIKFEGCNEEIAKDQPEYNTLPAAVFDDGTVVTCWKLTDEEKKKVSETGEIWLSISTFKQPLQPLFMSSERSEHIVFNAP